MFSKRNRKVYVIVPITIPGMNKELFFEPFQRIIEKHGFEFSFLANKLVKKEAQDRVLNNPRYKSFSSSELKKKGDLLARHLFQEKLTELIQKKLKPGQQHFVYIEKNHPPESWKKTLNLIADASQNDEVEVIALVPLSTQEGLSFTCDQDTVTFPFSVELFMKCLDTVQNRKDHETLSGSGSESIGVLLEFMDFYRDIDIDEKSLKKTKVKYGFDRALYIPFMNQNQKIVITSPIKETLINALKCEKYSKEREQYLEDLNLLHENSNLTFEEPDEETIYEYIYDFLESLELLKKSEIQLVKPVKKREPPVQEENKSQSPNEPEPKPKLKPEVDEHHKAQPQEQALEFKYDPSKQKTPLYLGVFPKTFSVAESKQYIIQALNILSKSFPQDQVIKNNLQNLQPVEKPHLVALDIGQDKSKLKTPFYKNFKEKISVQIELAACIIIPGKLILSLCPPDQVPVEIEDEFPHLVLSEQDWDSSETNQLLSNLFDDGEPFHDDYESLTKEQEIAKKIDIEINGAKEIVYFVQTGAHLILDSETIAIRQ